MDVSMLSKVGAFNTTTGVATTTVAVTGVGFQPLAVIFWWQGYAGAVDAFAGANIKRGFGVATSATSRWAVASSSVNASGTSATDRYQTETACIVLQTGTGSADGLMDFVSMDADGFTMIIDDAFTSSWRIHYMALGGTDLTNVSTGRFDAPGVTGNSDVTTAGFQPDCVLFGSTGFATDPPADTTTGLLMVGAAVSSSQQAVLTNLAFDNVTTMDTFAYSFAGECIAFGNGPTMRATFDSFLSNGFRLNWLETTVATGPITFYLALKGGSYRVNDFLTSVTPAATIAETSFGFAPKGTLMFSHGRAMDTQNVQTASDQWNVGAFTSTTERNALGTLDEDAVADSDLEIYAEYDQALGQTTTTPTLVGLVDVQSIDSDGFTLVMDSAADPAAFVWYISFGNTPGAAAENPYPYVGGGYYPVEG